MRRKDMPTAIRNSMDRHARLFELIRQQNLIATRRVGRKMRPMEAGHEAAFLAAAAASLTKATQA